MKEFRGRIVYEERIRFGSVHVRHVAALGVFVVLHNALRVRRDFRKLSPILQESSQ